MTDTSGGDSPEADLAPGRGLKRFQEQIERIYLERDTERGWEKTFAWFIEEVGELARALHRDHDEDLEGEFIDVAAWLVTLASIRGIDLEKAAEKYANGCPRCQATPCRC
ncbi:MAG: MazG nucleotide pyrophosphohydrolase domain-containing protein [Planctomycetota bacterium]